MIQLKKQGTEVFMDEDLELQLIRQLEKREREREERIEKLRELIKESKRNIKHISYSMVF